MHSKHKIKNALLLLILTISIFSCIKSPMYEKNYSFKSNQWKNSNTVSFEVAISDTSQAFSIFMMMRHTEAYPYRNIWLKIKTIDPDKKIVSEVKTEVPLAQLDGKWLGRGMNEIYEHKMPLTTNGAPIKFNKIGNYTIEFSQIMRQDILPEVMSIGLHIEKTNP